MIVNGLVFLVQVLMEMKGLTDLMSSLFTLHHSNVLGVYKEVVDPATGFVHYMAQTDEGYRALPVGPSDFRPYQLVTHFFAHGGLFHIFANMLALMSLGTPVEMVMGSKRFLKFYLIVGLFTGVAIAFLDPSPFPVLGASGAVSGVALAFGLMFPNSSLMIFPIPIPIRAWKLVLFFGIFSLFMVLMGGGGGVSHFGHLAGMLVAAMYLYGRRLFG
jgi:membrane associated rhomboid family serine protease